MDSFDSASTREQKLLLIEALQEKHRRLVKDESLASYGGFVRHFSEEPPPQRHHALLIDRLDKLERKEISNLIVTMPPGSAKSTYTSVLFPPYYIARNPRKQIIAAAYGADLAEDFGRKVRGIVGGDQYRGVLGIALDTENRAAGRWATSNRSMYYGVGVGGSLTGRRGDIGLIEDPVKDAKAAASETVQEDIYQWYLKVFRTRLKPTSQKVIIMTRWVDYDLVGRILPPDYDGRSGPVQARDGEVWEVLNLPMEAIEGDALGRKPGELLWPEWFTPDWVEQEKRSQGPRNWNALFQQNPTPDEGDYYKRDEFRWYDKAPKHLKYYMAGDYAVSEGKGDFSEVGIFAVCPDDNIYLIDWYKGQVNSLALVDQLIDFNNKYKPSINIGETGVIRRAVEPLLKRTMREKRSYMRLEWLVHSEGDKPAMGRSFQALVQSGRVYLPKTQWAEDLVSQLTKFPNGAFDDGADACALFGRYIDKVWAKKKPKVERKPKPIQGAPEMTFADLTGVDYG